MKKALLIIAIISFAIAIAGFLIWGRVLGVGSGDHGEHWVAWSRTIDIIWMIIPAAFVVSVVTGIASAAVPPRSQATLLLAICVIVAAIAAASWIVFVMTHLGIS